MFTNSTSTKAYRAVCNASCSTAVGSNLTFMQCDICLASLYSPLGPWILWSFSCHGIQYYANRMSGVYGDLLVVCYYMVRYSILHIPTPRPTTYVLRYSWQPDNLQEACACAKRWTGMQLWVGDSSRLNLLPRPRRTLRLLQPWTDISLLKRISRTLQTSGTQSTLVLLHSFFLLTQTDDHIYVCRAKWHLPLSCMLLRRLQQLMWFTKLRSLVSTQQKRVCCFNNEIRYIECTIRRIRIYMYLLKILRTGF